MKLSLDLRLKGARSYVHGTDMLNATIATITHQLGSDELKRLNFTINRMTSRSLYLMLAQEKKLLHADQTPVTTMSFEANYQSWHGMLVEESGEPTCRYPYDEESIVALCQANLAENCITLEGEPAFTPIEIIVSMTKALHQTLYPDAHGKWVFCRWESECWPVIIPSSGFSIVLSKALGSRLTKSAAMSGGKCIGWVYFSAKVNS